MCRSEPQTPVASMRTIASSESISSGSGRSSTLTTPGAWNVTARIATKPTGVDLTETCRRRQAALRPGPGAPPPSSASRGGAGLHAIGRFGHQHLHDGVAYALAVKHRLGGQLQDHQPVEERVHAPAPGDRI